MHLKKEIEILPFGSRILSTMKKINCAKRVTCLRINDFEGNKACGYIRGCLQEFFGIEIAKSKKNSRKSKFFFHNRDLEHDFEPYQ